MRTRIVQTDGIAQQVLEAGEGPLVLLIHGFPELSISWRAQVKALADAGYHAVAPDMRGYGGTLGGPERREDHTILHLVGDMVDLVRALGEKTCVVIGHDWGAPVAWHCALLRPDIFGAVAGLSVPFQPRNPSGRPIAAMRALSQASGLGDLYILRFQQHAEVMEFTEDPKTALRKCFWAYDGSTPADKRSTGFVPGHQMLLQTIDDAATLPPWMSPEHFAEYVQAFSDGGFTRPFAWYRCLDLNWSLTGFLDGLTIDVPSLFIVGENDPVRNYAGRAETSLSRWLTDLRGQHVLPGAGHWIQQERPDAVNRLLLDFLGSLAEPHRA